MRLAKKFPALVTRSRETTWYVSPTGTGLGSFSNPMSIDAAIGTSGPVRAGDTVYLRAGTYTASVAGLYGANSAGKGAFRFLVSGSSGNSITFRSYPGENACINGGVEIYNTGGYIDFRNIECAPTPTTRSFANVAAVDIPAIYVLRPGVRFLDCYIHDYQGVYPMEAVGFEMNGCVLGWNGWYQADTGYNEGYNVYAHNDGGGAVSIKKNAFLCQFASDPSEKYNVHLYSPANDIRDYDLQYNVLFQGVVLFGGDGGTNSGNIFSHNYLYGSVSGVFTNTWNGNSNPSDLTAQYNYIRCVSNIYPLYSLYYNSLDFRYNTVVQAQGYAAYTPHPTPGTVIWNNNAYQGNDPATAFVYNGTDYNFADWKTNSGFDAASTRTALPTTNVTAVIKSDYSARGFVVIYNYAGDAAVSVDISGIGLTDGASCRLRNCQNYNEYIDFIYHAVSPSISISMLAADWSLRSPTAYDSPISWYSESFPTFGIFLIE